MVVYSKEVENSLNDIWLDAALNERSFKTYTQIKEGLKCLDKGYINRQESQYPAWRHINLYEIDFGNHHFGYSWDGINVVVEYYYNPLKRESTEHNNRVIRLTETQFKSMLTECITKIIDESKVHASTKRVGKYKAIDGSWWDGCPHGLENFGSVQDVRMYDNTEMKGDKFETIGLFRQISSMKFFFAKIVPIKGSSNTKWIPIHIEEVPKIILKDLKTINPHGQEPYLPF